MDEVWVLGAKYCSLESCHGYFEEFINMRIADI